MATANKQADSKKTTAKKKDTDINVAKSESKSSEKVTKIVKKADNNKSDNSRNKLSSTKDPVSASGKSSKGSASKELTTKKVDKKEKPKAAPTNVNLPETSELLKAGVQFGHESKRWNPNMDRFIFGTKNNIHIIDISQTLPLLEIAGDAIAQAIVEGPVVFLGSKRQASDIVRKKAIEAGAHFVDGRWAGGLLTNFNQIRDSFRRLLNLENDFEQGVTNRTKYEISLLKKEWEKLNRLYSGVKTMTALPKAVFVVDPNFEYSAVRECNYLNIPVIAIVDTNTDPRYIDFPIPANDDAIGSIQLISDYISSRVKEQNSEFKVNHVLKDYSGVEVEKKTPTPLASTEKKSKTVKASIAEPVKANSETDKEVKTDSKKTDKVKQENVETGMFGKYQKK